MDVGPLLDDSDSGPPAERTMIGGAGFDFGPGAAIPEGDSVTATHPPMATEEAAPAPGMDDEGFFEGEIGDVPPDAGAQVGMPELDEPLVDDFREGGGLETFDEVDVTPRDGLPAPEGLEPTEAQPALPDEEPGPDGLDRSFVFAETVQADALPDDLRRTISGEGMPELLIDEGPLEAGGSEEVTARQSPLPPAPEGEESDKTAPDDAPKKGFFRKLFRNK